MPVPQAIKRFPTKWVDLVAHGKIRPHTFDIDQKSNKSSSRKTLLRRLKGSTLFLQVQAPATGPTVRECLPAPEHLKSNSLLNQRERIRSSYVQAN